MLITSSQSLLIIESANSRDDDNSLKLPLSIQRNKDRDIDCLNTSRDKDNKYDNYIAIALKQRNKIQGLGSSYAGCLGPGYHLLLPSSSSSSSSSSSLSSSSSSSLSSSS